MPVTVEPTVALQNTIHVGQSGGSQTMALVQVKYSLIRRFSICESLEFPSDLLGNGLVHLF